MKRHIVLILLLLSLCILNACSAQIPSIDLHKEVEPTAQPTPSPTPSPSPTPVITQITVTDESADLILMLAENTALETIDATESKELDALLKLTEMLPDCEILWNYDYGGVTFPSTTSELVITDESLLESIDDALKYLPNVTSVDLTSLDVSFERMDELIDHWPDVDFICMVHFMEYTVRSDITIFSTLRTGLEGNYRYTDKDLEPLFKYCKHLRALDIGHNNITDLSLIGQLTDLQVLIIGDNPNLVDCSPLANLTQLHYLELFLCKKVTDFSWLYSLVNLEDVCLSYELYLEDVGWIDNMPNLKRVWMRTTHVTNEMIEPYSEQRDDFTYIVGNPRDISAMCGGWRATSRCERIRNAFTHWKYVGEYRHWDDIDFTDDRYVLEKTIYD